MCGDPFDEIQCEDYYGDEPEPIDDGFDSLTFGTSFRKRLAG